MLLLDHHLLWGCIQALRAMLTAALAAPSPPPAVCWFLLQPSQLNSSCRLSMQLVIGLDSWMKKGWKFRRRVEGLSWRVRRRVEEKLSPEKWYQGDNPLWSEERNCLLILSWQHRREPRVLHGLRKYLHFPTSQTQQPKRQSFSFWF